MHEWQTAGSDGVRSVWAASSRTIVVGLLLFCFLGLAALLVHELLLLPAKTTLIAAVAEDYRWPLPPCGWSHEDIDNLKNSLGGQTLSVRDLPLAGVSSGKALAEFAAQFDRAARQTRRDGTVVVYVSAHGVVDREGRPCLLLPAADPLDSSSWLHVSDLLAQIKSVKRQESVHWLLILDANRQSENWNIGLLQNTFAGGLAKAVTEAGVPKLAVLNSTSPGEVGWSSLHFRGTVFAHFLQLGLAGAADENGDGQVSLQELHRYLKKNVDAWACKHRAAHQTPMLCPGDAADCRIAWSLNAKDLARLTVPAARHAVADEASAGGKLAALWLAHERLEAYHPHHYAPGAWQEVEHHLVWLEQAATAGTAYRGAFEASLSRIQSRLDAATQLLPPSAPAGQSGIAPIRFSAVLSADKALSLQEINVYSLPLAGYLGTGNTRQAERSAAAELAGLFQQYDVAGLWPSSDIAHRAMELELLGQRLAVPHGDAKVAADERAHAVISPLLDEADQLRRIAEDSVFIGPREAPDITARLDSANEKYGALAALEVDLARAYQLRDRAWAELPYLAQWAARQEESAAAGPAPASGNARGETPKLKEKVLALIDTTQRLDATLRRGEQASAQGAEKAKTLAAISNSAADVAREIGALLDQVHAELYDAARRLPLAPATPETLREIDGLLAMPMVSGGPRADLYAHYIELAEDIDSDTASGTSPVVVAGTPPDPTWPGHPLAALLGQPDKPANPDAKVDLPSLGEALRAALRGIAASADTAAPPGAASSDLLDAERPLRRLASLRGAAQGDSFRRIQRRHLQDLLLWHGQRALDDFWGTTKPGVPQYFAAVAEAYIADVRLLAQPDAEMERSIQRLGSLLERRSEAAIRGLASTSTDLVLVDEASPATAQVGIRETSAAAGLPAGIAAVYLRDDNRPIPQTLRRLEVGLGAAGWQDSRREVAITVQGRDLANRTVAMQAVVMFRGHEFPAPLMQRNVGGPLVEVRRPPAGPSRVTLRGTRVKKASVVFILDCSHSMADAVPVEAPDSGNRVAQMPKMNIAIDAMQGMLERLGEQGDVRVGVRFFGHRVGWRTDQNGVIARQENYPGGVPATLRPYEDIEQFLPLGRFDSVTAGNVNRRLKTLKPWGESPIFLALMQALNDFSGEDAYADRHVVVITDGMNYQFNPPPEAAPSLKDVETAYASHGVGVDIVGFGIPDQERSTAVSDFTQLAQGTKGSFTLATNASSLIRRLDQLLVKTRFRVLDDQSRTLGEADLGGSITLKSPARSPQVCTIEVEQLRATTLFRGGEALQLAISRDGRKIISLPYEEERPIFVPLVTAEPASPSGYHAGLHRPIREAEALVFPISFQRDDAGIPLPPAQVWIEITPLTQGRRMVSDCYVFFDASYELDMPVPLMRCRCLNWPKGADQAEVRVWCSGEPVAPTEVVPLAKVADRTPLLGEGFELACIAGVRYQVRDLDRAKAGDRLQIRLVERHTAGVPANAVKVELFGRPDRMAHQFDWDRGIVLHSFEYDAGTLQTGPPAELRFCTRDKFTSVAWRMEQPMILDIARHIEVVLPPRRIGPQSPPAP
jgi:hypothetical protein